MRRTHFSFLPAAVALICLGLLQPRPPAEADPARQAFPSEPLSLAQCVQLAEHNDPFVWSQRAQLLEAAADLQQARTLPNPSFAYTAQDFGLAGATGSLLLHQAMIGFAPFAALLRIQESRAACAARGRVFSITASERRQLRDAVGRAFYELLLLQRLHDIEGQAVRLAEALLATTEAQKQAGDASGLDLLRARAELADAQRSERTLQQRRIAAELAFSILLGADSPRRVSLIADAGELDRLPPSLVPEPAAAHPSLGETPAAHHDAPAPPAITDGQIAAWVQQARRQRPELQQVAAEQVQAAELARLATLRALPLADLQVAGGIRSSVAGVGGVVAVTGSLPLLDWNPGPRGRAQAGVLRASARQLDLSRQIALEVESSARDYFTLRDLRTQQVLPLTALRQQALARVQRQFAEGLVSSLDVVMASRDLLLAQRTLAGLERDILTARWRLAASVAAW